MANEPGKSIRIGGASGYWGDSNAAPAQLVDHGNIDYLVFDYLAEVTMAILAKLKSRKEDQGYAHDFVFGVMKPLIAKIADKKIKVIANAGGVNLEACRKALEQVAREAGVTLKIGTVEGDDLLGREEELRKLDIKEMQKGLPLPPKLMSVNAYLGAFPIAAALEAGADIVLTGRCVDSAVSLAPLIHEFKWKETDFDLLAQGALCGHLLECGAQVTGGNFTDWRDVEAGWENVGWPVAECFADGSFIVTKPENTGGAVSPLTVAEQMLYEIGDPAAYILPDVVCDFTGVTMVQDGKDRVKVAGARGRSPTRTYKVSATYPGGFRLVSSSVIAGFDAPAKARRVAEAVLNRVGKMLEDAGLPPFGDVAVDVIGDETLYGASNDSRRTAPREVVLRVCVQHARPEACELLAKESVGTALAMTTGRCGIDAGRPSASPMVRLYSFLIDKEFVDISVKIDGAKVAFAPFLPPKTHIDKPLHPDVKDAALPPGRRIEVPLIALAVARSGDKGDGANVGVIARKPEYWPVIRAGLTAEAVKAYFAHYVKGEVERFDLPGLHALNFLMHDALAGGGTSSVRLDTQAKTFGQLLLSIKVSAPEAWSNELAGH
ncbi:MAG: acyclic terpene utilization AtuA family protein [Rhodoblastus sp.]